MKLLILALAIQGKKITLAFAKNPKIFQVFYSFFLNSRSSTRKSQTVIIRIITENEKNEFVLKNPLFPTAIYADKCGVSVNPQRPSNNRIVNGEDAPKSKANYQLSCAFQS